MKKIVFILFYLLISVTVFSQTEISEENLSIEIKKARKIGLLSVQWQGNHGNILPGKGQKRVQLRFRVKSIDEEDTPFDPNKLYFVNDEYEARFAISEISFANVLRTRIFTRLVDKDSEKKAYASSYDPSVPNTFLDYPYKKYQDVMLSLNFGTKRKPNIHTLYFKPKNIKDHPLDIYFVLPDEIKEGRIYYGDTFIKDINFR
ncbi:hypothetical protein ULMS_16160 [Patiriisocius marinistellae]|uniref:Uncharacterized protein n=1 Tax=Patiriisocius marinistellae TaxID=2494560 RepID=A0A5J4FXP7_9FLAO|nr:hypothetical protein [Patiriisocius marinistellae]GEQ86108.1 hypothetical protein ULMS_16160 [Patiriisocius marinistellae]